MDKFKIKKTRDFIWSVTTPFKEVYYFYNFKTALNWTISASKKIEYFFGRV